MPINQEKVVQLFQEGVRFRFISEFFQHFFGTMPLKVLPDRCVALGFFSESPDISPIPAERIPPVPEQSKVSAPSLMSGAQRRTRAVNRSIPKIYRIDVRFIKMA